MKLFHVSSHPNLKGASKGDIVDLSPGPQGAEGGGVYFSEGIPRTTAAEGAAKHGQTGVVVIEATTPKGWWRTKSSVCRKFGRPRTWHTSGKSIRLRVKARIGDCVSADWEWI